MKARKKPVVIEFVRYDGKNEHKVKDFVGSCLNIQQEHYASEVIELNIETLEGWMRVSVGDYVIKGVNGEFYPCKPDIFEKTYDIIGE